MVEIDTLGGLLSAGWPGDPDAVLVRMPDGTRVTYGDAWARSGQLARVLGEAGVRPGDRVAVQIEKSPLALLLYVACVRAGAVLLPLNPAYTDDEVAYLLGDAEPTVFVHDPGRTPPTPVMGLAHRSLEDLADQQPTGFEDVPRSPDDLAALVYTSGTTGRPKGAMLSHHTLAWNGLALSRLWGFRPDDVLVHALPLFHVHGLFVATNCVLASGSSMVLLPRFDARAVLEQLDHSTVLMGVPTHYTRLLAQPDLDAERCRPMRLFVSGSAPLLPSTQEDFRRRTGHTVVVRYGLSETTILTSTVPGGEPRPGSVGPPLPGVELRVVARPDPPDGAESAAAVAGSGPDAAAGPQVVPAGTVGEIEVRGPAIRPGYWRRPEVTASEHTSDGFFRTGDVGWMDGDGYLTLVARSKDVIISGGLNVYPREVEDVLDQLDGVAESAVVGAPHPDFGEAVVAVVVASPGASLDEASIRAAARQQLAAFKVPKQVRVVDALPRNTMGKVEKARLRADLANLFAS